MQVKPGLVSSLLRCHSSHFAASLHGSGRGPTIAMCPIKTFHNCGNSSNPVFRSNPPILVTRGSFFSLNAGPSRSFNTSRLALSCSASTTMVRNLYIGNALPNCPDRICLKKTGPFEVNLMATAASKITGNASKRPIEAPKISMPLFQPGYLGQMYSE